MVHSCTAMNILRQQWGQPAVVCVSQVDLDLVIEQIGAFADYQFKFFDAGYYHNNGVMQVTSSSAFSFLNSGFGQAKNRNVRLIKYNFLDSFWYNPPFLNGQEIDTYMIRSGNDEVFKLSDPNQLSEAGYINFVLS